MDGVSPALRLAAHRGSASRALACAGAAGLLLLGPGGDASASQAVGRTTRTYAATIHSGTRAYARASGTMGMTLALNQTNEGSGFGHGPRYTFVLTFRGAGCRAARNPRGGRCLALSGVIRGSGEGHTANPDLPSQVTLRANSGRLASLGSVSVGGTILGTGFIASGHRTAAITLTTSSGTVSVFGEGPRVPGFTSP